MAYQINTEISDNFTVIDSTNNFVVGIDPSEFQVQLYNPNNLNIISSISVTITELGLGSYRVSFTPNRIGSWYLVIIHPTYFSTGKSGSYWVIESEVSSMDTEVNPAIKTVNFGTDGTGLTTVGYALINNDGSTNRSRITDGIFELKPNSGVYGAYILFDDPWTGVLLWDDGQSELTYASEQITIDTTGILTVSEIVDGIEASGGKLDTIYEKLPEDGIADAQDSTTIINITTDIESKVDVIDDKIDNLAQDATTIIDITTDIESKVDVIDDKIDNLEQDTNTIINTTNRIEIKVDVISEDLKRVLGLVHENIFIDLPIFDDANNLIGARLRLYSNSSSAGTNNNVLATYAISSDTNDEPGKFTNWKQERI